MKKNFIAIISIIFVAALGTVFTQLGMAWYNSLTRPSEWVPSFVFPIVWTIIYLLFAIILVREQNKQSLSINVTFLLIINGVLNVVWCLVFFTLNQLLLGNIIIIINLIFGIKLYVKLAQLSKINVLTLIYPIWLSVATTLNLALWILN